jgi:hypothetical protein
VVDRRAGGEGGGFVGKWGGRGVCGRVGEEGRAGGKGGLLGRVRVLFFGIHPTSIFLLSLGRTQR